MLITQSGDNRRRVRVNEELIKFTQSPNYINMKKFLKNRNDYMETTNAINNAPPGAVLKSTEKAKPVKVHPPLPPYPPPPDSPPNLNVIIKQEREDEQYDNLNETLNQEKVLPNPKTTEGELPEKTMCKMFVRGECNRIVCKYAHELIISQLKEIYTFCWNYQNARCTFPKCKFVHATVFEEAEFYRTGYLPPHTRSHLNKPIAPPTPDENQTQIPVDFSVPPPSYHTDMDKPMPVMSYVPASHHTDMDKPMPVMSYVPASHVTGMDKTIPVMSYVPASHYTDMDKPMPVMSYVPASHHTDMGKPIPVMSYVPSASSVEQRTFDNFTAPLPCTSSSLETGCSGLEGFSRWLRNLEAQERLKKKNAKIVKFWSLGCSIIKESLRFLNGIQKTLKGKWTSWP